MTDRQNAMFVIYDDTFKWTAFVICTILGDDKREHGWYGDGETEVEAIEDLQKYMRKL